MLSIIVTVSVLLSGCKPATRQQEDLQTGESKVVVFRALNSLKKIVQQNDFVGFKSFITSSDKFDRSAAKFVLRGEHRSQACVMFARALRSADETVAKGAANTFNLELADNLDSLVFRLKAYKSSVLLLPADVTEVAKKLKFTLNAHIDNLKRIEHTENVRVLVRGEDPQGLVYKRLADDLDVERRINELDEVIATADSKDTPLAIEQLQKTKRYLLQLRSRATDT